ncbi:hypothetical protein ACPA54_22780 [Uniformispora flossi]|uniref:hypothetical protein n=1 Tax=Uniformispora flossi TaxID=3390723 RepID=UPI003C2BB748
MDTPLVAGDRGVGADDVAGRAVVADGEADGGAEELCTAVADAVVGPPPLAGPVADAGNADCTPVPGPPPAARTSAGAAGPLGPGALGPPPAAEDAPPPEPDPPTPYRNPTAPRTTASSRAATEIGPNRRRRLRCPRCARWSEDEARVADRLCRAT